MLKVDEVAEVLRISRRSAYRLITEGFQADRLHAVRIGHLLRVERSELERYLTGKAEAQGTLPWA